MDLLNQLDTDLTNLNWVTGTPVPLNVSVSPTESNLEQFKNATPPVLSLPAIAPLPRDQPVVRAPPPAPSKRQQPQCPPGPHKKPKCSYTCLIGMALKSSVPGCLPVNEIYKYIEQEFSYFRTAPEGWKNSIRHNLSLNQAFRKVHRSDGWQGKKGYFWEINPDKLGVLNREVEKFLRQEGRQLIQQQGTSSTPIPSFLHASSIPRMPRYSPYHPPTSQMFTPPKQVYPPTIPTGPPFTPHHTPTYPTFDTSNTPTHYIGIEAPATDPQEVARDLFGLELSTQYPYLMSEPSYGYPPLHTTTSPNIFGIINGNTPLSNSPSPLLSLGPNINVAYGTNTSPLQMYFTSPGSGQTGVVYSSPGSTGAVYGSAGSGNTGAVCGPAGSGAVYGSTGSGAVYGSTGSGGVCGPAGSGGVCGPAGSGAVCGPAGSGAVCGVAPQPSNALVYHTTPVKGWQEQVEIDDLLEMIDKDSASYYEPEDPLAVASTGKRKPKPKPARSGRKSKSKKRLQFSQSNQPGTTLQQQQCPSDLLSTILASEPVYTGNPPEHMRLTIPEENSQQTYSSVLNCDVNDILTSSNEASTTAECTATSLEDLLGIATDAMTLDILGEVEVNMEPNDLPKIDLKTDLSLLV